MDDSSRIVVGVDGSAGSREALRYAMRDAARRGARLAVVRVFEPPQDRPAPYGLYGLPRPPSLDELTANVESTTRTMVGEVAAELGPEGAAVPADVVALLGSPAKVLVEQARRADALVLGHRGRGALASALLGSVGLHCVLHATCPVTIVRSVSEPAQPAPGAAVAGQA
ncbi:universal stress protein [Pseudonocardia hydrocarbonoxydans]|uniref:universal stress protein n=1 Tax=Pseudonocardia hydrocarbonoxydans TaxID=76726 RepID=UPI0031E0E60D